MRVSSVIFFEKVLKWYFEFTRKAGWPVFFFPSTPAFYTSSWVANRHCAPCTSLQELIIGFSEMLWAVLISHGRHEIGHNANIYTIDIGKHYRSGFCVFLCYHRTSSWIVKLPPAQPCLSSFLPHSLPPSLPSSLVPFLFHPPSSLSPFLRL